MIQVETERDLFALREALRVIEKASEGLVDRSTALNAAAELRATVPAVVFRQEVEDHLKRLQP